MDNDKQVVEAARSLIREHQNVRIILGDLADPGFILSAPGIEILDFSKPVALLLVAVVHFIIDDTKALNATNILKRKLVPGSYVAIAHASRPPGMARITKPFGGTYRSVVAAVTQRSKQTLRRFFSGTTLLKPGIVFVPSWRPKLPDPYLPLAKLPFVGNPEKSLMLAGVGRV